MPDRTQFAGLERLHLGEALTEEFLYRNQSIIDRLLQIGASTHKHDAHAALADAVTAPTVTLNAAGGTIPAATPCYVGYTFVDADGGETILSATTLVTTDPGLPPPDAAPTAAVSHAAGTLLANTNYYAVTVVDGTGGETELGPAVEVVVDPGSANSEVVLTGLTAIVTAVGGTEWRMWRAIGGGNWQLLNHGAGDTMTDDGSFCPDDSVQPPDVATTHATSRLTVTVPAPAPAGAVSFNLYLSTDGSFADPALVANHPIADVNTPIAVNSLTVVDGSPPPVSLTLGGVHKIDPDTEVLGVFKRPVANAAALPGGGNGDGDIRETLNDHVLHVWTGAAWAALGGGGGGGASLTNPMGTELQWTDPDDNTVRARVVGKMRRDDAMRPYTEVLNLSGHADQDPADGYAGYKVLTNLLRPATAASRATLDTDGQWSAVDVVYGKASRAIDFPTNVNIVRLGIGLGDAVAHKGIFAWVLAGATWKLQIVARTDGTPYGGANETGFTIIATVDIATPAVLDSWWLTFELKHGNKVAASLGAGKVTIGDIVDTPLPAGAITDSFGDAGTVTKKLMTADRWTTDDSWTTNNVQLNEYTYHPEVWADVLPLGAGAAWVTHRLQDDRDQSKALFGAPELTYEAAYAADGTIAPFAYMDAAGDGVVRLSGRIARPGGAAIAPSELVGHIGTALQFYGRPANDTVMPVAIGDNDGQGLGLLSLATDGSLVVRPIYAWTVGHNPWISLEGFQYRLA